MEEVYLRIEEMVEDVEIFILSGDSILCPSKLKKFDFYVVMGVECPLHKFDNAVYMTFTLSKDELSRIKKFTGQVIYDSTYSLQKGSNLDVQSTDNTMVVSKNDLFRRYYAIQGDFTFFYEYKGESKMDFLMTRINKAEKIRNKQIFAVIFSSYIFEELAIKVKNQLINSGKFAYLLHLKNIHYNRLITIEGMDAIVLIDCPLFDNLNIDIFIPIVTPCEINYVLNGKWSDKYISNNIDEKAISCSTDLTQVKGAGEIVLQSGFIGVEFGRDDKDYTIYKGQSGIADSYENEGK